VRTTFPSRCSRRKRQADTVPPLVREALAEPARFGLTTFECVLIADLVAQAEAGAR
jgi:hypothetical protein